ncbi:MAG: hypothetical protein IIA11_02305 [Proteobacteria bacterium]|nr:hypothetical protein [Pseudomonadota bacterium]
MNIRDDCAEHCPYTGISDRPEYQRVFPSEENLVYGQGSSKGANVFMNNPGLLPIVPAAATGWPARYATDNAAIGQSARWHLPMLNDGVSAMLTRFE